MLLAYICNYLKSNVRFLILDTYLLALCIYVNKYVMICGYFSKPKGFCKQKNLLNTTPN